MKRNLLLVGTLFIAIANWAAPRSREQAATIAQEFFSAHQKTPVQTRTASDIRMVATSTDLLQSPTTRSRDTQPAFYVYNRGQEAFVIVSGDDRMKPVLGYSEDGAFVTENLPENLRGWLEYYAQACRLAGQSTTANPVSRTTARTKFAESVAPLLRDIQYNQDTPYNNQCPLYDGKRCMTGCVATAAAQIMRYWKHPSKGEGSHTYTTASLGIKYSFNFATHPFDWDNILPAYTGTDETAEEIEAVSTLMLACGVACNMDYAPGISGASDDNIYRGLIKYLDYDEDMYITSREYYTADEWMDMIKTELNGERPVYYSGSSTGGGHAFVIDGYDSHDMVHVNWGWGGYCNGYFEMAMLNADSGSIGGNNDNYFQFDQSMIVGLQPNKGTSEYVSRVKIAYLNLPYAELTTGYTFTATATGMYNMVGRLSGSIGLIAEKDGMQTVLGQRGCELDYRYGWSELELEATVSSSLADGTYELYMASKANNETKWNPAYGNLIESCTYKMVKQGRNCTLYSNGIDFDRITGKMELGHNLYKGHEAGFIVTVKNENDSKAFFGELSVCLLNENDDIIEILQGQQATIEPGGEIRFKMNNAISADAGTYYAYVTAATSAYYYYIDDGQAVTIKEPASGTPTLSVSGGRLEKSTVESGNPLNIHANLSVTGTGDINTTWLYHTYTREGENEVAGEAWDLPFVEKGTTSVYGYDFRIDAEPGRYVYQLYTMHPHTQLLRTVFKETFTVTETSGIEDATADETKPYICSAPGESHLRIHSDAGIESITIYGMSGQTIGRMHPETNGNEEYTVPVDGLAKGSYLTVLRDKAGKTYTLKFIR